jgi:DNA polymerase
VPIEILPDLVFNDIETFNPYNNLKKVGDDVDSRDVQIILCSYAIGEEPVRQWQLGDPIKPVRRILDLARVRIAHNAAFEMRMFANDPKWHIGLFPQRWHCTMAQAYAHSMPGALDALCRFLGVPQELQKKGGKQRLIRLFCNVQRNGTRVMPEDRPDDWAEFMEYNRFDTIAMRECYRVMPQINLEALDRRLVRKETNFVDGRALL